MKVVMIKMVNTELKREKQLIITVTKSDDENLVIRNSLVHIPDLVIRAYNDPCKLMNSSDFRKADVFIVSVDLNGFDGRTLYLEQKNRLRIIPFLFIIEPPIKDEDWDYLSSTYSKDLYDYIEKPINPKEIGHRVSLMLTITHIYNMHTIDTIDGLRNFWKESVIRDREMLQKMRELYKKEK
jgi:response regulator RpfG family c-di-GMP phosphodiesterase